MIQKNSENMAGKVFNISSFYFIMKGFLCFVFVFCFLANRTSQRLTNVRHVAKTTGKPSYASLHLQRHQCRRVSQRWPEAHSPRAGTLCLCVSTSIPLFFKPSKLLKKIFLHVLT